MQNKTVLIAGATGMVGKALVSFLIEKGFSVIVISRNVEVARSIFTDEVTVFSWQQLLDDAFDIKISCDVLVNLAGANIGANRWTKQYKKLILESRINSVLKLEELVNRMSGKPKVWIQASAIGLYEKNKGREKGFLANVVEKWEEAFNAADIENIRKLTLRFGIVLSHNEGMLYQMKKVFNFGVAACPGNGKQNLTWIHIDDLTQTIYQSILNENWLGVINAVAPYTVSMWEFIEALKNKTKAFVALKIPGFIFQLVLGKEKANELVLANQNVKPEKLLKYNFQYEFTNIEDVL